MRKRTISVLLLMMVVALTASLMAAPRVTLILTDGDAYRCELVDLGRGGFTVRADGEEEELDVDEVAVIDFVGGKISDAEIDLFEDGQHLVVLRNGNYFYGRLDDIGGNNPLRLTFKVRGGTRNLTSNDVRRIFLNELD